MLSSSKLHVGRSGAPGRCPGSGDPPVRQICVRYHARHAQRQALLEDAVDSEARWYRNQRSPFSTNSKVQSQSAGADTQTCSSTSLAKEFSIFRQHSRSRQAADSEYYGSQRRDAAAPRMHIRMRTRMHHLHAHSCSMLSYICMFARRVRYPAFARAWALAEQICGAAGHNSGVCSSTAARA